MLQHKRTQPMTIDKRITGEKNALEMLHYVHRFGWLTTGDLARIIWPKSKQAVAMARRTAKANLDRKLLLKRELPDGGYCYALSAAGARVLAEKMGVKATSGASLPLGNPVHRACSNSYLIHHLQQGNTVYTEFEIQTGKAPIASVSGKVPDGLVVHPEGLIWLETENAWKNRRERQRIVDFCIEYLPTGFELKRLASEVFLLRVAIISTNELALNDMVRSFREAKEANRITDGQLGEIEIGLLPVDKSLNSGELVTGNLFWDGI